MSIKGSSIVWLERALERGDLLTAWTTAHELKSLPLDHALALVVLAAADERDAARFDAAARRWALRYLTGARSPTLADLRAVIDALDELPSLDAITALGAACERLQLPLAARALDHLLPREVNPAPRDVPRRR